jgi:hypothetical protein
MSKCTLTASLVAAQILVVSGMAWAQGVPSSGQDAQRASQAAPPAAPSAPPPATAAPGSTAQFPTQHWKLPAIDVPGEPKPELREEDRVGSYGQPRWTANRRFPTTRMYVIPEGKVEAEFWMRYTFPLDHATGGREVRNYYEMGFGLGHRLQLDIYFVTQQEGHGEEAVIQLKREQIEVRYALADWGKIWGNPTLYLEWQRRTGEHDWIEPKLLLGGQIAPGWHAGFNLVLEKELGGSVWEHEYNVTAGLSRTIVDQTFHVGVEGYVEVHDFKDNRFKFDDNERLFLIGPSFLVQPIAPMHLLISPLIGKGSEGNGEGLKDMMRIWFVSGWTF